MNPYLDFVKGIQSGVSHARTLSASGRREIRESASKVLIFSPHPDDECIIGLLPLRLMRETGRQVINVPVTFGSKVERQATRAAELEEACAYLGWDIARARKDFSAPDAGEISGILEHYRPEIIFFPHDNDWNSRHISTHRLVVQALESMGPDIRCAVVETEFWGAMENPNLMVEGNAEQVADLVAATSLHKGEVDRNPYHLLLPAWMQDNVRRGGELVGGQGRAAPDFDFATLYRLRQWADGGFVDVMTEGAFLPADDKALQEIFPWK